VGRFDHCDRNRQLFQNSAAGLLYRVNFDKDFLEPGSAFKTQIETKLQEANVFIIVCTGAEKRSHGYTGWEVGYFDRVMRTDPDRRKKISLYLYGPPAITTAEQGIPPGLSEDQLQQSNLLKLTIFQYLKGTVESVVKPQKQITIRARGVDLGQSSASLPPEAELRPLGKGGSMDIFGLSDEPITWKKFVDLTNTSWQSMEKPDRESF
jgi:hypothetical protein